MLNYSPSVRDVMGPLEMLCNCISTLLCVLELENESYSISDRLQDPLLRHRAAFFEGLQPPRIMYFPAFLVAFLFQQQDSLISSNSKKAN